MNRKQIDEARMFQKLGEEVSLSVWVDDEAGNRISPNPACETVLKDRAVPEKWLDEVHADDREATLQCWRRGTETGQPFQMKYRIVNSDKPICWISENIIPDFSEEGEVRYIGMRRDITEEVIEEEKSKKNVELLESIRKAHSYLIDSDCKDELFEHLLCSVLELTESKFGFIGEIRELDSETPYFKTYAISNVSWDEDSRNFYDQNAPEGMEFYNMETLFGQVVLTGEKVISNNPEGDPRSNGTPPGHPHLESFLGLPLYHGEKLIGMLGIANRSQGYDDDVVHYLEPFIASCASLLMAWKDKQYIHEAERKLHNRLRCEKGISEFSHLLLSTGDTSPDPCCSGLYELREAAQASCVRLIEIFKKQNQAEELFGRELCAAWKPGVTARDKQSRIKEFGLSDSGLSRWRDVLPLGELVSGSSINLPHEEKAFLNSQGIQSILLIPVFVENEWYGYLEFQDNETRRQWEFEDVRILKTAAEILGSYLERQRSYMRLKQYSIELERSNQDLNDFASIASHDLKEPLRKIVMFGDLLGKSFQGADEQSKGYLERMQYAAVRMQRFIDDLLSYSRIHTTVNQAEPVNLETLIQDVLVDLEERLKETGGRVVLDNLPVIKGHAFQLRQLFLNLISNGLKFHKPGVAPEVQVTGIRSEGPHLEIHVRDNGIGFDKKYVDKIFKPFERLHRQEDYEGTGIGLAICKKIANLHQGTIEVDSQPNHGTCFVIRIPAENEVVPS